MMSMKYLVLGIGLLFGIFLVNYWDSSIAESELTGSFRSNHPQGKSYLTLKTNRTFLQILQTKGGKKYSATGTWTFDSTHESLVSEDILWLNGLTGTPNVQRSAASYSVERLVGGGVQIIVSPDDGIAYSPDAAQEHP
jgi:hypothetical protein